MAYDDTPQAHGTLTLFPAVETVNQVPVISIEWENGDGSVHTARLKGLPALEFYGGQVGAMMPDGYTFDQMDILPSVALGAFMSLADLGQPCDGEAVIIHVEIGPFMTARNDGQGGPEGTPIVSRWNASGADMDAYQAVRLAAGTEARRSITIN